MFGDLLFAVTPFSTWGTDIPEPYAQLWVNLCPEQSDWVDQETEDLPTKECGDT